VGRFLPLPTGLWALVAAAGLIVATACCLRRQLVGLAVFVLAASVFCGGAVHARLAYYYLREDHVVFRTSDAPILATLRGRIVTSPNISSVRSVRFGYHRGERTSFIVRAEAVRTSDGWRETNGLLRVTVDEPTYRLSAGCRVELVGRLGRYGPADNPGRRDPAAEGRIRHTPAWMSVPGDDGVILLGETRQPWYSRALWHVRAATRQHLTAVGDDESGHLIGALIVGERRPALERLNRAMVRAGIAHFLSISGLHLGVFLGFVYLLCRLFMLSPRTSAIVALVVLAMYLLLAEPRAPLLRSAVMAAALCLSVIFHRRYAALNALAAAAVFLLAIDPLQLFTPGFQLSFAIVLALVVARRRMRDMLFGRWIRRRGLMVFRGDQRMRRWVYYSLANRLMDGVSMALLAYLAAAPLVAYHFGLFSPYAPLLSVLMFPVIVAVLVPGYVSMALAWVMPNLSWAIGRMAAGAADALAWCAGCLEHLPGICFELRPVGLVWVAACYASVGAVLFVRERRVRRWCLPAVGTSLAAFTVVTQLPAPAPPSAQFDLLAVGAGQCAVLRTPSGKTFILDAGTQSGFDAGERVLVPFLRRMRLPAPSAAICSHANTDHFNALPALLERGSAARVYLNDYFPYEPPDPLDPDDATRFIQLCRARGAEIVRLRAGQTIQLDRRTEVKVLWPPADRRGELSANDTSLALKIICDSQSLLLAGDIGSIPQAALARMTSDIHADVLVLPHHGSWEDTLPTFVDAVDPKVVLLSASHEPRPPADRAEQAEAFHQRLRTTRRYYSTPRDGWIRLRFGGGEITVDTMR